MDWGSVFKPKYKRVGMEMAQHLPQFSLDLIKIMAEYAYELLFLRSISLDGDISINSRILIRSSGDIIVCSYQSLFVYNALGKRTLLWNCVEATKRNTSIMSVTDTHMFSTILVQLSHEDGSSKQELIHLNIKTNDFIRIDIALYSWYTQLFSHRNQIIIVESFYINICSGEPLQKRYGYGCPEFLHNAKTCGVSSIGKICSMDCKTGKPSCIHMHDMNTGKYLETKPLEYQKLDGSSIIKTYMGPRDQLICLERMVRDKDLVTLIHSNGTLHSQTIVGPDKRTFPEGHARDVGMDQNDQVYVLMHNRIDLYQ